jgi:broad specificity phosphatase PhoE
MTRHGQDQDNREGILNGHRDKSLTEKGIEQAHEIADKIKESNLIFDTIYSSPLRRAFDTAKIISETTSNPFPKKEELLIERDFGIMTGKKISDIESLCAQNIIKSDIVTYFLDAEGAETFPTLLNRAGKFLNFINKIHKDGSVLLVTSGDVGKMIYAKYYNLDWKDILTQIHFGNCDLLLLSENSPATESHVFKIKQHNL